MGDNEAGLRYWNRRITRRRVLGTAAAGGAAAVAITLVGCSGDSNGNGNGTNTPTGSGRVNDGTQDGPGKPGGILRVRQATGLPSMNPFGPGIFALAQQLTLGFTVFDHMWYVPTDTGVLELFLATKVEQPDPLTVIATIGDATFHDKQPANGRTVSAEDIAASYKRFREEAPIGYSWLHQVMDDVVAVDDKTVRITQKRPWAWVYTSSNAGSPISSSILPQEILDMSDLLQRDAVGSGHWVLDGHENGTNLRFRRFDQFRQFQGEKSIAGQPFLEGVDSRFITDENVALGAFDSGDLDQIGFPSRRQQEAAKSKLGDRIVTSEDLSRDYLNLMLKWEAPWTDLRVRQAINKLIDRDEAILLLNDGDGVKAGPMPPVHRRYVLPEDDDTLKDYFTPSIDEAKRLLDAAGFDYDEEHELKHSNRPVDSELAQVLKEQLGRGGVKIRLVQEDLVKWFSQTLNQHQYHMTCFQHLPYEDPDLPLRFFIGGDGEELPANFMEYNEPEVNDAILAAAGELNEEERVQKVYEAQRVIIRNAAPMINILSAVNFGARYAYVKGSITGRGSYGLFNRTTWLDKA